MNIRETACKRDKTDLLSENAPDPSDLSLFIYYYNYK